MAYRSTLAPGSLVTESDTFERADGKPFRLARADSIVEGDVIGFQGRGRVVEGIRRADPDVINIRLFGGISTGWYLSDALVPIVARAGAGWSLKFTDATIARDMERMNARLDQIMETEWAAQRMQEQVTRDHR